MNIWCFEPHYSGELALHATLSLARVNIQCFPDDWTISARLSLACQKLLLFGSEISLVPSRYTPALHNTSFTRSIAWSLHIQGSLRKPGFLRSPGLRSHCIATANQVDRARAVLRGYGFARGYESMRYGPALEERHTSMAAVQLELLVLLYDSSSVGP